MGVTVRLIFCQHVFATLYCFLGFLQLLKLEKRWTVIKVVYSFALKQNLELHTSFIMLGYVALQNSRLYADCFRPCITEQYIALINFHDRLKTKHHLTTSINIILGMCKLNYPFWRVFSYLDPGSWLLWKYYGTGMLRS